jgi:hypothetical protein
MICNNSNLETPKKNLIWFRETQLKNDQGWEFKGKKLASSCAWSKSVFGIAVAVVVVVWKKLFYKKYF